MVDAERGGGAADAGRMAAAAAENWALPDWGAFSESCASDWGSADAWSDVEADVSVETSSVGSTQHQRIYREQRARRQPGERGSGPERTARDLRELHLFYLEQRRQADRLGDSIGVRREEESRPEGEAADSAQEKLVAQQAEMQTELKAVRQQLTSFQEKWVSANAATSTASTAASSVDPQHSFVDASRAERLDGAVQRDAARQWLLLLAQKVETVAQDYAHGPNQSFLATIAHLTGLKRTDLNQQMASNGKEPIVAEPRVVPSHSSGWRGLKEMASSDVSEQIETLETAITNLTECVRGHSKRQMECFDQSIRQLQAFHNDRVQRVVDESLDELKLVRGRYRKKEERLEAELRSQATWSVNEWQQRVEKAELQHKAALHQLAASKAQMENDRKQYEADLLRVRELLESAYVEKEEELGRRRSDHESASFTLEQTRAQVSELQARCKALIAQQERAKELYDLENLTLRQTIDDLRQRLATTQSEHAQEKQRLEDAMVELQRGHHDELNRLELQVKEETRARLLEGELPVRVREVERRYRDQLQAFKRNHDAQVAELTARIEEATALVASNPAQQRTIEVQTVEYAEPSMPERDGNDERVEELTRKCRALEKLLDKKFEDASESLASSRLCASCHSENASLRHSAASRSSSLLESITSPHPRQPRSIEKSKALARALLSSSHTSLEDALFPDADAGEDDTLATEEQTTMNAVDMWDSASFTSADSMDDASSLRPLPPRAPSTQAPSTQEMAALARKLKRFATNAAASSSSATSSHREPDPEMNSDARGATRRLKAAGGKKTPATGGFPSRDTKVAASDRRPKMAATGFSSFDDLLQSISSRRTSPK